MSQAERAELVLENRHTGERLVIRRMGSGDQTRFDLEGSLPPGRAGPPLHIHFEEDEEGRVISGTLSAIVAGQHRTIEAGHSTSIPRGAPHRWWNAGREPLVLHGQARPAVDLDRYLQAVFEIINAGPVGRPPLFYLAHLALRHRQTQAILILPSPVQAAVFRVIVAIGMLLGRYRGTAWPGCPVRCVGIGPEGRNV